MATAAPLPPSVVAADAFPVALAAGTPAPLRDELVALLGEDRVLARAIDLVRYASDASPYRLIPQVVVMAHDAVDVAKVFAYGRRRGLPVTLRAGGTSLNGQGQSDGILVDVRRHFSRVEVLDGGERVRCRPGIVLGRINRALAKYQRRVGPDPASTDIATIGGVIANNSGGMRCGVKHDAYQTLRSLTFVLPSGTTIDTAAPDAAERFAREEPELAAGLAELRDELRADAELAARVRRKFEIKNTTGYRLCAFLDADEPVEIFRRLLVGSEGTLAFVAEAELQTVPHGRHTSTALLFFDGIDNATKPVAALVEAGATAVELMVNPTLIAAAWNLPGVPEAWKELPPEGASLLVELRSTDEAELDGMETAALAALADLALDESPRFTRDRHETEIFWLVREGMQGIIGAMRPQGSALLIEDVCVPPARIAEATHDIRALLGEHGFLPGAAGHASAGNLHFLLTPALDDPADVDRYEGFMTALVALIVDKYDGSLKAEHGTGRNMAPYVEHEWGAKATEMMWRVKRLADPDGVLNPDSVLSTDPGVHLRHLKSTPAIEDVANANACIECGFCEPVCPSRHITTTPRQRIVVRREMARQPEGSPLRAALAEQFAYDGDETCAADGSCRLVCPVSIDTGKLIKSLRVQEHPAREERRMARAAQNWATVEKAARGGLRAGSILGNAPMRAITTAGRRLLGDEVVPAWSPALPGPAPAELPATARDGAAAVYLPSCLNRMMGPPDGGDWLPPALVAVSARAGMPVWIPDDVAGVCCAMPWSSKGFTEGEATMTERFVAAVRRWTGDGALPLVIDASSCTHGALETGGLDGIEIVDGVSWARRLLPSLTVSAPVTSATVHPTCSTRHLGLTEDLHAVVSALADHTHAPVVATCCGMAGDRGLLHPELTEAATRDEAREVTARSFDAHVSSNRTCEIAMESAIGRPYEHVITLLERATRT
ncbi:MAG: FAD-binding and (Fe-S)-binding domain-containing protein [Solirubrobacteraceae bacterium]